MSKVWRVTSAVVLSLLILFSLVLFLSYRLITESLPQTKGTLRLHILQQPVEVYRDSYGVPHLFAANELDLFRAQGFVVAQDRLWQMDLARRAATGTLSEVFGRRTVEDDKFFRLVGFARIARTCVAQLSDESRAMLQAYADGVNAYMAMHKDSLPVEFSLLRYDPKPWTIEDSIALTKLLAWRLSLSWKVDLVLQRLVDKLGMARARELFPVLSGQPPYVVTASADAFWSAARMFLSAGASAMTNLAATGGRPGSNAWVVSGDRTASGQAMLANDPHLEMTVPSVWYQVHLAAGDIDVAGVTMPGIPGVMIGRNRHIAWGVTSGMIDDVDFYRETVHPDSTALYLVGQRWHMMSRFTEEIRVKDQPPVSVDIRFTRNGPVISGYHPAADSEAVISMRWVGQQPDDGLLTVLQVMKATDWQTFSTALQHLAVPAQNYLFASAEGDIGYHLAGRIPIRTKANGTLPHNGRGTTGQWRGYIPFDDLPHSLNPRQGFIVAANNAIVDARYPYYLSNLWEPPWRAVRIGRLLAQRDELTRADFKEMQMDVESEYSKKVLPMLLHAVQARLTRAPNDTLADLYHLIKDWDGVENHDSVAATIFHAFFLKLTENTLKDEMGETLYQHYVRFVNVPFRVMTRLLDKHNASWFDDVDTPEAETVPDMLARSLLDAGTMLRKMAGESVFDWRWGALHQLTLRHPLGSVSPLDQLLNIGPLPAAGSVVTIHNSQYEFDRPFEVSLAPSARQIVDWSVPDSMFSIIAPGQSGQWMSPHYDDQVGLWQQGGYHRWAMSKAAVVASCEEVLILQPGEQPE